jgi:tetratricopeptide (TPR) repeat protein
MKKVITFLLIVFSVSVFAQNVEFTKDNFKDDKDGLKEAKRNIEEGDKLFEMGSVFYKQAIDPYLKAQAFNPNNALLNFKIGKSYLYSNFKLKSIPYLEKALQLNPNVDPQMHYVMAKAYHLDMQWDKAISEYKAFQATLKDVSEFKELIEEVNKHITE